MSLIFPGYIQRDPDYYITDFSEYTIGVQPPDWTSRYGSTFTFVVQSAVGALSGKALRWTKTNSGHQAISWDRVPFVADAEILLRCRALESYTAQNFVGGYLRGSGSLGAEQGYRSAVSGNTAGTLWQTILNKYISGSSTTLGTGTNGPSPNYTVNTWIWTRFRLAGTSLSRKTWYYGSTEPGSFDEVLTDSSITGAGWSGLHNISTNPDVEIDFVGIALRGKTVPLSKR